MRCLSERFGTLAGVLLLAWLAFAPPAAAQRLLLNLPPIKGSSVLSGYANWIDVYNYAWAEENPGPAITPHPPVVSTNPPVFADVIIQKSQDAASSNLLYYCAHGLTLTQAVLVGSVTSPHIGKSSTFFRLELSDVYVSSVSAAGNDGDDRLMETIGLQFRDKCVWTYSHFNPTNGTFVFDSNSSFKYSKATHRAAALTPFQVSGNARPVTVLTWPAAADATYDIGRSTSPAGPFLPYLTVTNGVGTNMSCTITNAGSTVYFYSVQGRF